MEKTIKLARYRSNGYIINYPNSNGNIKRYEWVGSKGSKVDIKPVPEEVVDWLLMTSVCFKKGELVVVEDSDEAKEVVENIGDIDEYKNNSHTKDEIIALLKGNINKMKKELGGITSDSEKRFILEIAREISDDIPGGKTKFLSEWLNIPQDVLFS